MKNLISRATSHISSLINGLQVKRFLAVVLVGFILLTTNVDANKQNNKTLTKQVREQAQQIDSVRPKTTKEWYKEARETEDSPGERLGNGIKKLVKQKTLLVSDLGISQKNQHKP